MSVILFDAGNTLVWVDHPFLIALLAEHGYSATEEQLLGAEAEAKLREFDPQIEEIDAPIAAQQREIEAVSGSLAEMRREMERLERVAADKKQRLARYEERLAQVRLPREQAAIRAEIDLVSRAEEADQHDMTKLREQMRRTEHKLDEMQKNLVKAQESIRPAREELMERRREAEEQLAVDRDRRENQAMRLDQQALRLYQRVRAGRTRAALAPLMADGACGHCFNVVPMQEQREIKSGSGFARCEACGTPYHPSCFEENGGCAVTGCAGHEPARQTNGPLAGWGSEPQNQHRVANRSVQAPMQAPIETRSWTRSLPEPNPSPRHSPAHPPGWYADPWYPTRWRWYDGQAWTGWTSDPTG
jgi:uncharacterized protein